MKDCLVMKSPASWHRDMYREGAPTGNGKIGALVYGGIAQERIAVNHSQLWSLGKVQELPDIHESLQKTREAIDKGDYWNANWISAKALKELGYDSRLGKPCPLCDIQLELLDRKLFQKYRRIIHMDTGEVTVTWQEGKDSFTRNLFVSRSRDLIFYEVLSDGVPMDMLLKLDLHETYEEDASSKRKSLSASGAIGSYSRDKMLGFYGQHEDNTYYGAIGRVTTDGEVVALDNGSLSIKKSTRLLLVVKPFINESYEVAIDARGLFPMAEYDYVQMKEEHEKLHGTLYGSVELDLTAHLKEADGFTRSNEELLAEAYDDVAGPELLEKQWKFGRYLMVCGTREDGLPFPLYGIWHGRYTMAWPHNMANENVQMIYWHTLAGGLPFAVKTLIKYYTDRIDVFKECARKLFGLPGIYVSAGTTPGNYMPNQVVPVIINWIGCAGWLSQHFYDYYKYTGDEEALRNQILPFMLEAATFYEHYLVKDDMGKYKIYPSVSPENTPGNLIPKESPDMAHPCPSVINATMDIAIIKELITNLLEISEQLGQFEDKRQVWQDIVSNLPSYDTTEDGDVKEWQYPGLEQRYNHRHLSHIYPVFPGSELVKGRDDDGILAAFELAVDKRILGAQTGWSLAHMACIYARFQKPEKAIECLDILSKACLLGNLFTLHNDWRGMGLSLGKGSNAPVQLDAAMGCVQAIQEMLLYAGKDFIKLLPALPARLGKGSIRNIRFMTGRLSMQWDMDKKRLKCKIEADRDTKVRLYLPEFVADKSISIYINDTNYDGFKSGDFLELSAGSELLMDIR